MKAPKFPKTLYVIPHGDHWEGYDDFKDEWPANAVYELAAVCVKNPITAPDYGKVGGRKCEKQKSAGNAKRVAAGPIFVAKLQPARRGSLALIQHITIMKLAILAVLLALPLCAAPQPFRAIGHALATAWRKAERVTHRKPKEPVKEWKLKVSM